MWGAAVMKSLSDDVESLCLVKECCELQSTYGTNITKDLLTDSICVSKCIIRKSICGIDRDRLVLKCSTLQSLPSLLGLLREAEVGLNFGIRP